MCTWKCVFFTPGIIYIVLYCKNIWNYMVHGVAITLNETHRQSSYQFSTYTFVNSRRVQAGDVERWDEYYLWGSIPDILKHTLFFPVPPPPDLNKSLNCSLCKPSTYAYSYHEGYVVLVYRQHTPKGLRTTSRNSWTWIKSHNGDKDLPKALCCWRTTIEDWDYRQLRKTLF